MGRVFDTHLTKHGLLSVLSEKNFWMGGGVKCRGDRLNRMTSHQCWTCAFGPSNPRARIDRTRLPSDQQYCYLPTDTVYNGVPEPIMRCPQTTNKSYRKRNMQRFRLVIFQSFNFSCITFLNYWLKNWGDFCVIL
jgi:hypothetical protein